MARRRHLHSRENHSTTTDVSHQTSGCNRVCRCTSFSSCGSTHGNGSPQCSAYRQPCNRLARDKNCKTAGPPDRARVVQGSFHPTWLAWLDRPPDNPQERCTTLH